MRPPWVMEGEPWCFWLVVPLIGILLLAGAFLYFCVIWPVMRLLGFDDEMLG